MAIKQKRLGGFSNIHIAKISEGGAYATPVPLEGGKSVEVSLNYENVQFYADNAVDYSDYIFSGGEGTLTVSGLTSEEYVLLFGATKDENGVVSTKTSDIAPEVALLFERKKLGTNKVVKYIVYACKFAPVSINATTMEGSVEEETVELTFSVRETADNKVYSFADGSEVTSSGQGQFDTWYEEVVL